MENHGSEMTKKWIRENPKCYRSPIYLDELQWLNSDELEEEQKRIIAIQGNMSFYGFSFLFLAVASIIFGGWLAIRDFSFSSFFMMMFLSFLFFISGAIILALISSIPAKILEIEGIKRGKIRMEEIKKEDTQHDQNLETVDGDLNDFK